MDKTALRQIAAFMLGFAGDQMVKAPESKKEQGVPLPPIIPHVPLPTMDLDVGGCTGDIPSSELPSPSSIPNPFSKPPVTASVEVDSNGLPWDARIHSRTKSKNSNGAWKLMRGIDPQLVKTIEDELRAVMSIPVPPAPSVPSVPIAPVPVVPVPPIVNPTPIPVASVPAAPIDAPPVSDPTVTSNQYGFPSLMAKITSAIATNKIKSGEILEIVASFGLPSLPLAATRPDLIPGIMMAIDEKMGAS